MKNFYLFSTEDKLRIDLQKLKMEVEKLYFSNCHTYIYVSERVFSFKTFISYCF